MTKEKIDEIEIESIVKVFVNSLENKKFAIKNGKAEVPLEKLEEEPRKITHELMTLLKELKQKRSEK